MISVIMPIYIINNELWQLTKDTIKSLKDNATEPFELIIIDNNGEFVVDWDCDILVRNKSNVGNGKGWSQGLKLASGDKLLLTDNDVFYKKDWQKLANFTDNSIVFPTAAVEEYPIYSRMICGFSWMMDRKTYEKVGDICPDYGIANFEDTDYFKRAMDLGIKLKSIEDIFVFHYGRKTCDLMPEVKAIYEKNKKIYESKFGANYPYLN